MTTNYAAYDKGCPNHNPDHQYTWYLTTGRTEHLGIDISAAVGAKVYAIADGRVRAAGTNLPVWGTASKGVVLVEHFATNRDKFTAAYGHMTIGKSPITGATWRADDVVRKGDVLGTIVTVGTGPHLHFGIESGSKTQVEPVVENGGTGNCVHQALGTTNPETYLKARSHDLLAGSIVGYKNGSSVTSWRVQTYNGALRRYWIETTAIYSCLYNRGEVDRGPMPARFLDQIPDRTGYKAACP